MEHKESASAAKADALFKFLTFKPCIFLVYGRELVLAYTAQRAYPAVGNILELRSCRHSVVRIADCRIIYPATYIAYVLHLFA